MSLVISDPFSAVNMASAGIGSILGQEAGNYLGGQSLTCVNWDQAAAAALSGGLAGPIGDLVESEVNPVTMSPMTVKDLAQTIGALASGAAGTLGELSLSLYHKQ